MRGAAPSRNAAGRHIRSMLRPISARLTRASGQPTFVVVHAKIAAQLAHRWLADVLAAAFGQVIRLVRGWSELDAARCEWALPRVSRIAWHCSNASGPPMLGGRLRRQRRGHARSDLDSVAVWPNAWLGIALGRDGLVQALVRLVGVCLFGAVGRHEGGRGGRGVSVQVPCGEPIAGEDGMVEGNP